MSRRALTLAACLAWALGPAAPAGAVYPDAWQWTLEAAPSVFSPRMHGMDNALVYEGINVLDLAWRSLPAAANTGISHGYSKIEWGYGGQIGIAHEFNEDLRGGLFLGLTGVWKSEPRQGLTDSSSWTISGSAFTSSTTYRMDVSIALPLVTIGVYLHKVFRYEEEPNLRTYIGGWGAYGSLVGGDITAKFTRAGSNSPVSFSADLTAQGYNAGGLAGIEYAVARTVAIYGETGFQWCIIPKVQWLNSQLGSGRLGNSTSKPLNLDYSGFFIRAGVKVALGGSSSG